jgi:putative transposase
LGEINRKLFIINDIKPILYDYIRSKTIGLGGYVYAMKGVEDHVHLVVHIPRTIPVAQFVGKIKGVSSAKLNESGLLSTKFYWQQDHVIFTISEYLLPRIIGYVEKQEYHHQEKITPK